MGQHDERAGQSSTGKIKFFNPDRGFGFIAPDTGGKDIFVHVTALERGGITDVQEGTRLAFDIEDDRRGRGKQAANLRLLP